MSCGRRSDSAAKSIPGKRAFQSETVIALSLHIALPQCAGARWPALHGHPINKVRAAHDKPNRNRGAQMPMAIDEGCIIRASEQFWEQMLAMQLTPVAGPEELNLAAGHVQGRVWLSGAWEGEIEVRMAETLAMMATSVMLMQPLETVAEADTLDATREIANMIAGNIKSALPQPSRMTLPEAAVECAAFQGSTRTADSLGVAFQHAAGDLVVRVQEHGERG